MLLTDRAKVAADVSREVRQDGAQGSDEQTYSKRAGVERQPGNQERPCAQGSTLGWGILRDGG